MSPDCAILHQRVFLKYLLSGDDVRVGKDGSAVHVHDPRRDRSPNVARVSVDRDPDQHAQSSQRYEHDAITPPT